MPRDELNWIYGKFDPNMSLNNASKFFSNSPLNFDEILFWGNLKHNSNTNFHKPNKLQGNYLGNTWKIKDKNSDKN